MSKPVWLEVALNGGAGQRLQPGIPVTPKAIIREAIDCAQAGAAIIHLHAYDDAGRPVEDADRYSHIIEGVRSRCDAVVYPTLKLTGSAEERFAPIRVLMDRGLLECGVIDPGSVNLAHRKQLKSDSPGFVYANSPGLIREGLQLADEGGWRPAFAIYEPGFARLGAALAADRPGLKTPIYRIMFSDHLLFGMPPTPASLAFYAQFLEATAPGAPWMLSGLDAEVSHLLGPALALGAHLRVGLEDAPLGIALRNLDLVERALAAIARSERPLATAADVRAG